MNKKQYNNIIDWTVKHEAQAQSEDSLEAARAICNELGVALPNGTMKEVSDTLATKDYMYWYSCTMQEAQEAANNGIPAIGVSDRRIVLLAAADEEQPVAETTTVMTLSENTSAYAVEGLRYYTYGSRSITTTTHFQKVVTVFSCSPVAWIYSSAVMGHDMSVAVQAVDRFDLKFPRNTDDFKSYWSKAVNCVVIHTHGSPQGLYDEECDENGTVIDTPIIISTAELEEMPANNAINFVMMTACETAGGNETANVAYWLSKKINPNGIVIANKYTVAGGDTEFSGTLNENLVPGWMVYKNGVAQSLPMTTLTMESAYQVFEQYR